MKTVLFNLTLIVLIISSCSILSPPDPNATVNVEDQDNISIWSRETSINASEVKITSEIDELKATDIIEFGICYALNAMPTINDNKIKGSDDFRSYLISMSNLEDNTTYFIRPYAKTDVGIIYGNDLEITTLSIESPCETEQNKISLNGMSLSSSTSESTTFDEYYIKGIKFSGQYFRITFIFPEAPITGIYRTTQDYVFFDGYKCRIDGLFGGTSFGSSEFQNIYVDKLGEDSYNLEFCDLEILNGTEVSGNLTVQ